MNQFEVGQAGATISTDREVGRCREPNRNRRRGWAGRIFANGFVRSVSSDALVEKRDTCQTSPLRAPPSCNTRFASQGRGAVRAMNRRSPPMRVTHHEVFAQPHHQRNSVETNGANCHIFLLALLVVAMTLSCSWLSCTRHFSGRSLVGVRNQSFVECVWS